jgi:hypothetical protein
MQREADPGYRLLSRLMNGPDQIPARDAEDILSLVKSVGRDTTLPEMRTRSQGIAAITSRLLQPAIDASGKKASPEAFSALQSGRAFWKQKAAVGDLLDSLGGADPAQQVSTFKKLTAPLDSQYDNLNRVLKAAPEAAEPLKKAYLTNLFEKPTANGGFTNADGALANWSKLGPKTKAALFGEQANDISTFLKLAKRLNENPNPSGTGTVNALIRLGLAVAHPMTAGVPIVFSRKLADVLYSPEGAQNLKMLLFAGERSNAGRQAYNALSAMTSGLNRRIQSNDQPALVQAQ